MILFETYLPLNGREIGSRAGGVTDDSLGICLSFILGFLEFLQIVLLHVQRLDFASACITRL